MFLYLFPSSFKSNFLRELQAHEIVKFVLEFATGGKRVKRGAKFNVG